jgi:hypothetical protein
LECVGLRRDDGLSAVGQSGGPREDSEKDSID